MKKLLFIMMCSLLVIGFAGCSDDDNDKEGNGDLSYLLDRTWVFKNIGTLVINESINYCFHSDGTLEVIDNSEYGPLFFAPGKHKYEVQLCKQPKVDAVISGALLIDNKYCTFDIQKDSENPNVLSLHIFYSTESSLAFYWFTTK